MRVRLAVILLLSLLALTACGGQGARATSTADIYRPPAPAVSTPQPEHPTPDTESGIPGEGERLIPTPACSNSLWFLEDLTIPDGTLVTPGERLDKRWQVKNNGSCNWDSGYQVRLIAGPGMGVPVQQALYPALSGTEVVMRMIFTAPDEAGTYRSAWRAYDPQGEVFGDPFFIEVLVSDGD